MHRLRFRPGRASLLFSPLNKIIGDMVLDIAISTAIVSVGAPSAYALVWEYGNLRQTKKGPKTTLGVDPETGRRVWLTIQAPSGYVRIWKPAFRMLILFEIEKVKWGRPDTKQHLMDAMDRIGERMTQMVKSTVPIDSGDLQKSITWMKPRQVKELTKVLRRGARGSG